MRSFPLTGGVTLAAVLAASFVPATQPIEPMRPKAEQQVEVLRPKVAQSVEEVTLQPDQEVSAPVPISPTRRAVSTAGKVVLGVTAAGIAVGAALLSLLFL